MKKLIFSGIVCCLFFILSGINCSFAYIIDGDIKDWGVHLNASGAEKMGYLNLDANLPSGGLDIDYKTEDNTDKYQGWKKVEPGWSDGNRYDAEAFYFDNDEAYAYLAIVTGLAFDDNKYPPGDIFIGLETDGTGKPVYKYAIDVSSYDSSDETADFYDGITSTAGTTCFSSSSPWIVTNGTTTTDPVEFVYEQYESSSHYVLEAKIALSLLGGLSGSAGSPVTAIWLHWTMQCGNDLLDLAADVNPVPEPASLLLVAMGLLGLGGARYKKIRKLG